MAYTRTMNGKVPQVLQELHFDETPTPGSLNPVTSGGVAESVDQQSSNIAPNYTKKTYKANSYVMQDGVLYTNPNAIGTAEDWNPAHWTRTTVAEMMAGAGGGYTDTSETVTLDSDKSLDIGEREVCNMDVTSLNNRRKLTLNCSTDCVIKIQSNGQDFDLILRDEAGQSLEVIKYLPYSSDIEYGYAISDNGEDTITVVTDFSLTPSYAIGGTKIYIRVTGHVALLIISNDTY